MAQCTLCDVRPATGANVARGHHWCHQCASNIAQAKAADRARADWYLAAVKYVVWKGLAVAMVPNGNANGAQGFRPKALRLSLVMGTDFKGVMRYHVPRSKVIDLDTYVVGFTREQIRKLKRAVKAANFAVA